MTPSVAPHPKSREDIMSKFFRMLENVFAAAAFAEAGDWDTAKMIAGEKTARPRQDRRPDHRPRVRA